MVDVEKELGPLFEKLDNQNKIKQEEYEKNQQKLNEEYTQFNGLIDTIILPIMKEYQVYLQKKAVKTGITREPKPGREQIERPSIVFSFNDFNKLLKSGGFQNVKFAPSEGKIMITTETRSISNSDTYTNDQINEELVKSKLTNLIKTCLEVWKYLMIKN